MYSKASLLTFCIGHLSGKFEYFLNSLFRICIILNSDLLCKNIQPSILFKLTMLKSVSFGRSEKILKSNVGFVISRVKRRFKLKTSCFGFNWTMEQFKKSVKPLYDKHSVDSKRTRKERYKNCLKENLI